MILDGNLPLRLLVPAVLVLGTGAATLLGAALDSERVRRVVNEESKTLLRAELVRVQQSLALFERAGANERVEDEIALIATEADCMAAILLGPDGEVRAATRRDLVGTAFSPVRLGPGYEGLDELLARARKEKRPLVELLHSGDAIAGIAPAVAPIIGALRGVREGFIIEVRDVSVRRSRALRIEASQLLSYALAAALATAAFLVIFHGSFSRRAAALVAASERLARGDYGARAGLGGRDELAVVGQAFDDMAAKVQAAQARLEGSERRYRTLFDALGDGAFIVDAEGRIADCNARAAELSGFPPEALVGMQLEAVVRAGEVSGEVLDLSAIRLDATALLEQTLVRQDGAHLIAEVSTRRLPDGQVQVLVRDVTMRRRMAEDLARTERLASVGTLAAGVAHEINNPLTYVDTNIELVMRDLEPHRNEAWVQTLFPLLADAREGADRVATVVRDLRGLTAGRDSQQAPVDLGQVVRSAVKLSALDARHRARVVTEFGEVPKVFGNEAQLGQVVVNLVINAAQAFREPGLDRNLVTVRTHRSADGQAVLEVVDNGPGIPPEVAARIFEPFFTTKPVGQGTGLGLFVCQRIVSAHGGRLTMETAVDRGTTMRIILPPMAAQGPTAATPEPLGAQHRGLRVLVVDDVPLVRRLAARALAAHDVSLAETGTEALDRCLRAEFDVILTDLMMPGMTGMELHARLSVLRPELADRMIFMSGGAVTDEAVAFLQRFVGRILEKPATLATIQRAVVAAHERRHTGAHPSGPELSVASPASSA